MAFFQNVIEGSTHLASHGTRVAAESMFYDEGDQEYQNYSPSSSSPLSGAPKLLTAGAAVGGALYLRNKYSTNTLARKSIKDQGLKYWVDKYAKSSAFREPKLNPATGLLDDSGLKKYITSQVNVQRFKNLGEGIKKELGLIGAEKGIGNQAIRFLSSWKVGLPSMLLAGGLLGKKLTGDNNGFMYGAVAGAGVVAAARMYNNYRKLPKLGKFGAIATAVAAGSALLIKNSKQDYSSEDYIAVGTNSNYGIRARANSMNVSGNITLGLHRSRH